MARMGGGQHGLPGRFLEDMVLVLEPEEGKVIHRKKSLGLESLFPTQAVTCAKTWRHYFSSESWWMNYEKLFREAFHIAN